MEGLRYISKRMLTEWLPNLILVAGLMVLIRLNLEIFAFGLILLSKWQIFRGGRKLWLRSVRDNSCDLVVAASTVALLLLATEDLLIQSLVAGFYYIWLVAIKPLKSHVGVATQSAVCQFLGLNVIFLLGRDIPASAVVVLAWLIAFVSADHLISAFHEKAHFIITLSWALIVAQLSWLFWRWLIVYSFFGDRILLPQAPIVITLLGYIFGSMYIDHTQTKLGRRRLIEYVILTFGLSIILIFGTQWDTRL